MLESLAEKLQNALKRLAGKTVIDKVAVDEFVKELQRALIYGDVDVKLVFELSKRIREKALRDEQVAGFGTRDHVLKVIFEELVGIVGHESAIDITKRPLRIMLLGLFGAGKTTTCGKLAKYLKKRGLRIGIIGADTYRPAAQEQLRQLSSQVKVDYFASPTLSAVENVREGLQEFDRHDCVIVDTAGRNSLDAEMIQELVQINEIFKPTETILVVPADLGQHAGVQAREFTKGVGITGVIVTKMEGTAKGGGALVSCARSGAPIKYLGVGEKLDDLEPFDPNGFISRVLGWGDIKALLFKAEEAAREHTITPEQMLEDFNLDVFYKQMEVAKSMGPMKGILQMLGLTDIPKDMVAQSENKMKKFKFIIDSMTRGERKKPDIITNSRMGRIAAGSGTTLQDVRELIRQFKQTRKMMKIVKRGRIPRNLLGKVKLPGGMTRALGGGGPMGGMGAAQLKKLEKKKGFSM